MVIKKDDVDKVRFDAHTKFIDDVILHRTYEGPVKVYQKLSKSEYERIKTAYEAVGWKVEYELDDDYKEYISCVILS